MMQTQLDLAKVLAPEGLSIVTQKLGGTPESWTIEEIGDGNVNLIFKVQGPLGKILIKQAVPYLRCVGESWPLSVKRNYFEYTAFQEHHAFAPEYLPEIYYYDATSSCMAMEFLDSHIILRKGMLQGLKYSHFSEHIADYMAKTLFFTSDLYLSASEKKKKMKIFSENVELCKITEDLIFTDPYWPSPQNRWTSPQLDPMIKSFQNDAALKIAATEMKAKFLTSTQALIHGDLHTGSIMVTQNSTKVIDPEFAFYGPMAFDTGLLLGNLAMSYFAQAGLGSHENERVSYEEWILIQFQEIWTRFSAKFSNLWEENLNGDYLSERLRSQPVLNELRRSYIQTLFTDSLRFGATEMIRRIFGLAHVADLDSISDPEQRAKCEAHALTAARELLVNHSKYTNLETVISLLKETRKLKLL